MFDFHIHSEFSDDSSTSLSEHAEAALKLGLNGICLTDHIDIDYANPQTKFELNFPKYMEQLEKQKEIYKNELEIYTGIEIGLQIHVTEENKAYMQNKQFDFVIGSIHCANKKELYGGSFFEGISDHEGIELFFYETLKCLELFTDYDVLGHPDVIRRYLIHGEKGFDFLRYKEYIRTVLLMLIQSGKGIEINTSGLRYDLASFHPMPEIVKLYKELGGEVITLGSDAHAASHIGYAFKDALQLLTDSGFKYYTIFKSRKPVFIKI